jgi:hypothetical protein
MILNFIFSNLNLIVLCIWVLFLTIVIIRFFRPLWVKNVSFSMLVIIAFFLNIFYGLFITWGQYYVWATGNIVSKTFVNSSLPKEVPFSSILEWARPLFENNLGYFLYYVLGRFWLYIFILFFISIFLYFILKFWNKYRGGFSPDGPLLILILMLIAGWPGILVLIPLSFIFSIFYIIFNLLKGRNSTNIEPAFIIATPIALILGKFILGFF